jgi:hypothetical protein
MAEYKLDDLVHEQNTKLVYVYDLFSMWTFFVLAAIETNKEDVNYPALLFSHGILPDEATTSGFRGGDLENEDLFNDFEDDLDEDDLDAYGDSESYEDQGFEENWN